MDNLPNYDFDLNVTAYRIISGRNSGRRVFYDGSISPNGEPDALREWAKSGDTVSPGFFKSLGRVASAVEEYLLENADLDEDTGNIVIRYSSSVGEDWISGPRGYTDDVGSYEQRSLTRREMKKLILKVDEMLLIKFYLNKSLSLDT